MRRAGGGGPNSGRGDEDERADERLKTSQFSTFRTAMASGHLPPPAERATGCIAPRNSAMPS